MQAKFIHGHPDLFLPLCPVLACLQSSEHNVPAKCEGSAVAQARALLWVPVGEEASSHGAAERTPGNSSESRISDMVASSAPRFLQGLTTDLFPGTLFFQEHSRRILPPLLRAIKLPVCKIVKMI